MLMANPNNSDTWRRRGGAERCLDDDGENDAAASKDYFGNLKKFERHDNMAEPPTRLDYNKKSGPV